MLSRLRSSLSRAPTLTNITSDRDTVACVCLCVCGARVCRCSFLLSKKTQSLLWNRAASSLEATICQRERQLAMAVRLIRGMEDVVASGSQIVWTLAHQTLRRWYNRGLTPCRRLLEAWFGIGKCYQVWALIKPHQHDFTQWERVQIQSLQVTGMSGFF